MIQPIAQSLKLYELLTIPRKKHYNKIKSILTKITNKENMVMTDKGRHAIYFALKDMGLKEHDEVIIPGYTCSIVREAVKAVCKPIFVDIDLKTLNIDLNKLKKSITKRTKAIVLVHAYGNPVDMNIILRLAKKHKLKIIEDCAQSMKAKFNGKYVGSFGDYTTFSFGYSKDLTVFKGGILLSKNKINTNLIKKLRKESSLKSFVENASVFGGMKFIESMPLFIRNMFTKILVKPYVKGNQEIFTQSNLSPSNYIISLIYKQFKKLDKIIKKRKINGKYYDNQFKNYKAKLKLSEINKLSESTYFRYNILVKNRKQVINRFLKNNIRLGALYDFFIAPKGMCPNSEILSEQIINIPVHQNLSKGKRKRIAKLVKKLIIHN